MESDPWSIPSRVHNIAHQAHPEDSLAIAEHMSWEDLQTRLAKYNSNNLGPARLLERAWLRVEYALATPDTQHDEEMFEKADTDIATILGNQRLPLRHKTRVNAALLNAYGEVFRLRAHRLMTTPDTRLRLQEQIGTLLVDFMADDDLKPDDMGTVSELITPYALLNMNMLPYLTSPREEANVLPDDNHDFYTLHPCAKNLVKKVPISVKHFADYNATKGRYHRYPERPLPVAMVKVGRIALHTASLTPPYAADERYKVAAAATRLAADIMACHALEETLDPCDTQFLKMMCLGIMTPVMKFANSPETPDYVINAESLEAYISTRKQRGE